MADFEAFEQAIRHQALDIAAWIWNIAAEQFVHEPAASVVDTRLAATTERNGTAHA